MGQFLQQLGFVGGPRGLRFRHRLHPDLNQDWDFGSLYIRRSDVRANEHYRDQLVAAGVPFTRHGRGPNLEFEGGELQNLMVWLANNYHP